MPGGARPPARPGAGPGRGKSRGRATLRTGGSPASAGSARTPASPASGEPVEADEPTRGGALATVASLRSTLTTRAIAVVVVLVVLTISYATSLRIYIAQRHEIATTQAEIEARQARIAELQGELAQWDDPAFVATQARSRLGWVVPGETGYTVVGPDGQPLGGGTEIDSGTSSVQPEPQAWWGELWGSVKETDQPTDTSRTDRTITPRTQTNESGG